MSKHIFLTDISQLSELEKHDSFTAICTNPNCCNKKGREYTIHDFRPEPDRLERYKVLLCQPCYAKYVKEKKYGDPNYNNSEKAKATYFARTGYDNSMHNPEVQAKIDKIMNENYGGRGYASKKIRNKCDNTMMDLYGTTNMWEVPGYLEHHKRYMLETYGVEYAMQNDELKHKCIENNKKNHGGQYYTQTDEFREEMRQKNYDHPEWQEKGQNNNREKRGGIAWAQTEEAKAYREANPELYSRPLYYYNEIPFDSFDEMVFYVYCVLIGIPIRRLQFEYGIPYVCSDGTKHTAYPDFAINGTQFVEVKGYQFFDENGNLRPTAYTKKIHGKYIEMTDEEKTRKDNMYKCKQLALISAGVLILNTRGDFMRMCKKYVADYAFNGNRFWYTYYDMRNIYSAYGKGILPQIQNMQNIRMNEDDKNVIVDSTTHKMYILDPTSIGIPSFSIKTT